MTHTQISEYTALDLLRYVVENRFRKGQNYDPATLEDAENHESGGICIPVAWFLRAEELLGVRKVEKNV